MNLNTKTAVLERGYAEQPEFDELEKEVGYSRFWTENKDERFWGISLGDDRFVLANHPLDFLGCPPVIGLVGVHHDHVMDRTASIELFKKTNRPIPQPS